MAEDGARRRSDVERGSGHTLCEVFGGGALRAVVIEVMHIRGRAHASGETGLDGRNPLLGEARGCEQCRPKRRQANVALIDVNIMLSNNEQAVDIENTKRTWKFHGIDMPASS